MVLKLKIITNFELLILRNKLPQITITAEMVTLKNKKLNLIIFLLLGFGYFNGISSLQISDFWKSQIAFIPIQLAAIIYVSYFRFLQHPNSPSRER